MPTCPGNIPYKCEDGACVRDLKTCFLASHTLTGKSAECLTDGENYLCVNNQSKCTTNLLYCPSSSACRGTQPVKSIDSAMCYASRIEYANSFTQPIDTAYRQCSMSNQYFCSSTSKCQSTPCEEWLECPTGQVQCWDGACASTLAYCRSQVTGCPPYLPFRCNFTATCVANASLCYDFSTSQRLA